MNLLISILMLLGGLALIYYGANFLTDGASSIARRMQVSGLVIGLTIVAVGTSTPELAVSLTSAIQGKESISLGNVVGSNIFNILAILGPVALISPLKVAKSTTYVEIPMLIIFSVILLILAQDTLFEGSAGADVISRGDGIILLLLFFMFISYTFYIARKSIREEKALKTESPDAPKIKVYGWGLSILMVLGGLAMLVFGGNTFTIGASDIARALGVQEAIIGLTLVAFGTSVPELATSIIAARKGHADMAIGNIVGSNIFNTIFILGITATVLPIPTQGITAFDFGVMMLATILLFMFTLFYGKREIKRLEGFILLATYLAYTTWLVAQQLV